MNQFLTLSVIAVVMTVGVYGLVAGIVKIDDLGFYLNQRQGAGLLTRFGRYIGLKLILDEKNLNKSFSVKTKKGFEVLVDYDPRLGKVVDWKE